MVRVTGCVGRKAGKELCDPLEMGAKGRRRSQQEVWYRDEGDTGISDWRRGGRGEDLLANMFISQ